MSSAPKFMPAYDTILNTELYFKKLIHLILKLIMCERFGKSKQTNTNLWAVESIGFIQFLVTNCTLTFDS